MKVKKVSSWILIAFAAVFTLIGVSACKGDGLEFDEDGNLISDEWKNEIPSGKTILAFDLSGTYSFAADSASNLAVKSWTDVYCYVWGGTIGDNGWGAWPGVELSGRCESNPKIFYYLVPEGKEGSGTFKFNTKTGEGAALEAMDITISSGKRYLVRGSRVSEF